jgi:tripartite-type tricarboxylate transporter receptor subunit TctC
MGPHIPGNPTIVVQNMPGAGSLRAANHIYNVAAKDGSIIGMISSAAAFQPLFGNKKAQFDTPKFTWIGNADEIVGTCGVWHTSGISSFEDLLKKSAKFGGAGKGSSSVQHVLALNNILGTKIELIKGYAGSKDINLAMQRGEVDGACGLSLSTLKASYGKFWKAGQLKPIVQLALEKSPELKGVPHIYDFAKSVEMRGMFDLIFGLYAIGRPVLAPPGVPADRIKALRTAFVATVKDPKFLADAKKARIEITASSGEAVEKLVKRFYSYPKSVVEKVSEATN